MAVMETKIIQVANDPDVINSVNEVWGAFGWNVLGVQITNTQNTKTYTKDLLDYVSGFNTVETTTINYATITYQRDTKTEHYSKLVGLQNEMERLIEENVEPKYIRVFNKKTDVLIAIGLVYAGMFIGGGLAGVLGLGEKTAFFGVTGMVVAPYLFYKFRKNKLTGIVEAERTRCQNRKKEIARRFEEILEEARMLVD